MARIADAVKRRQWAERLRRFDRGEYTVAGFCALERVSVPSFYQWRKKLANRAAAAEPDADGQRPRPTGRREAQTFVPLQVMRTATVEFHLPNGARVTLPTAELSLLQSAIAMVARLQPLHDAEDESC